MRIAAIALMLFVLLQGCGANTSQTDNRSVREVNQRAEEKPQTTVVRTQNLVDGLYYDGQVYYKTAQLSFPEEGTFDTFLVGLGEQVAKGQTLATAENRVSEREYNSLKDTAENLKKNYEFDLQIKKLELEKLEVELDVLYQEIEDTNPSSKAFTTACRKAGEKYREIESKKLEIEQLKETYDLKYPYYNNKVKAYKKAMGSNVITAPFDGVVVSLNNTQSGAYVAEDKYFAAIADTSTLCIYTDYMTEAYIKGFSDIYVLIDGKKYQVEYTEIDKNLYLQIKTNDAAAYSIFTLIDRDSNVEAGDVAKLVLVRNQAEGVLTVPKNATSMDSGGRFVYVQSGAEREKRYITVGIFDGAYYEVKEGLKEGEVIYVGN